MEMDLSVLTDLRPASSADRLAQLAVEALVAEATLTPKPGLVDRRGPGAHADVELSTMLASAAALRTIFADMARASAGRAPSQELREDLARIGREGERRMFAATGGANTHRGAIWALGLLTAAVVIEGCRRGCRGRLRHRRPHRAPSRPLRPAARDEWRARLPDLRGGRRPRRGAVRLSACATGPRYAARPSGCRRRRSRCPARRAARRDGAAGRYLPAPSWRSPGTARGPARSARRDRQGRRRDRERTVRAAGARPASPGAERVAGWRCRHARRRAVPRQRGCAAAHSDAGGVTMEIIELRFPGDEPIARRAHRGRRRFRRP